MAEGLPLVLADGTTRYVTGPGGLPIHQVTAPGVVSYYHTDQLGSTRALTGSTGKVVGTYAYDPYGNLASSTGSVANPFRYAGQYTDTESGLQQLRARYYDPATAQFISRDPIVALTRRPYTYADNSPLNATDPTGLDCQAGSQTGGDKKSNDDCDEPDTGRQLPNDTLKPPTRKGRAPRGPDGHPIELHHEGQKNESPLNEMTRTDHRLGDNFKKNHSNTGQEPSDIDRNAWRKIREDYWDREWDSGRWDDCESLD